MDQPITFVGAGNMGGGMLSRWLATGLDPAAVTVVRPSGAPAGAGVRVVTDCAAVAGPPATLILAVKPQRLGEVQAAVAPLVGPDTLLVSILAGVTVATLRARFPAARAVLRAMPNTPVAIGRGVVALHGWGLPDRLQAEVTRAFASLGLVEWMADEALFDAVTALAGSGPAFLFRFADALADGGAALGIERDQALRLALATVDGAAGLAMGAPEPPAQLADRVASPGGSTRAGLAVLDAGLSVLVAETLAASARRNGELGALAND